MKLEVLHAVNVDIHTGAAVSGRSERERVGLLVLLAVELEALLASGGVNDLARRAVLRAAAAAAGVTVTAAVAVASGRPALVVRRVGNLGLWCELSIQRA